MNKLLNELRIQAGIGRLEDGPWLAVIDKDANVIDPLIGLEKFAELIVKELEKMYISGESDPHDVFIFLLDVKERFGIE